MASGHPVPLADLVDLQLGELPEAAAEALEAHLFECPVCAARIDELDWIAAAVRGAAVAAEVAANVTGAFLERALGDGLSLREYRLGPGETVACSAGPEDLYVVRLAADFGMAAELTVRVEVRDLGSGTSQALPPREVVPDVERGEVVLVVPGSEVRAYPRSLWTIAVDGEVGGRPVSWGPFVMDHTP